MYCLKPPMTAPPEGTAFTLISFIIRQPVGTIYMSCAAYVTEAINNGYTWKGARGGLTFQPLFLRLSQGAGAATCVWTC